MIVHSSQPEGAMRDGSETKEKISRTALRLFVQKGVAETSIRDIATAAGISQGAMYNHYTSKDELAWELFSTNFSEIGHELRRRAKESETLEGKLRGMVRYVFEAFDRDWILVSFVFQARHGQLKRVTRRLGNPYLVFRTVIAEAMRHGEIPRRDPEVATSLVIGAIIQMIDSRILGRLKGALTQVADDAAMACVRLLKA
jgi:AcrR family transcriptional regulator